MKDKTSTILWAGIIATAVYILGTVIACIIAGGNYYYFCGLIIWVNIHPLWCILAVVVFVIQTVLVTVLLALDVKNKTNVKRDIIATTILGLVCLVLCLVPSARGVIGLCMDSLNEPKCILYSDNDRRIVIRENKRMFTNYYDVYVLKDDDSVTKLGGTQADDLKDVVWGEDGVTIICHNNGVGGDEEMKETFLFVKGEG